MNKINIKINGSGGEKTGYGTPAPVIIHDHYQPHTPPSNYSATSPYTVLEPIEPVNELGKTKEPRPTVMGIINQAAQVGLDVGRFAHQIYGSRQHMLLENKRENNGLALGNRALQIEERRNDENEVNANLRHGLRRQMDEQNLAIANERRQLHEEHANIIRDSEGAYAALQNQQRRLEARERRVSMGISTPSTVNPVASPRPEEDLRNTVFVTPASLRPPPERPVATPATPLPNSSWYTPTFAERSADLQSRLKHSLESIDKLIYKRSPIALRNRTTGEGAALRKV